MDNRLLIAKSEPLWNTNNRVIFLVGSLITLLFALPLFGLNSFYLHLFIMIFMHAVMAQSWNVIAGFSGQISLGHGAFFGIGAYATSFFYIQFGTSPWISMPIGILVSGIFGDLFESLLKRNFNLKDSGNKLPGHGGFLDRFDSFFFVIPYVYFYLKIIDQIT